MCVFISLYWILCSVAHRKYESVYDWKGEEEAFVQKLSTITHDNTICVLVFKLCDSGVRHQNTDSRESSQTM